jgi:putative ABC transport system permease protein
MNLQFKIIRKKFLKTLLSTMIIISLGVGLLFGLKNGMLSFHKSINNFIETNHYPDIKIITNLEDVDVLKVFNPKNYKSLDSRLSISTIMNRNNEILSVRASTYEDKNLDDFYVWNEKENKTSSYDLLVEKKFADNNDIKIGDNISLRIGENYYSFTVTKIVSIPEGIASSPINGLWGNIDNYGNVYLHKNVLESETNKLKNKLLNEVKEQEDKLNKEEKNKLNDFTILRTKLNNSYKEYNNQKNYYSNVKNDLNNKKNELDNNKTKLLELKKEYLDTINKINELNNIIDKYINLYESLSNEEKELIDNIIKKYYPDISIDDVEFLSDILYYATMNKIDELFDSSSEINKKIKNKIIIADAVLSILDYEYDFFNSGDINTLLEKIKNGEDVSSDTNYIILKNQLEMFSIFGEITSDNILVKTELAKAMINAIHSVTEKLPFDSFNDLYNMLDSSRILLPYLYNSLKNSVRPDVEQIINKYNDLKQTIVNKVNGIYNCNNSLIDKTREIKNLLYNYLIDYVDDLVINELKAYTNDTSGGPLPTINRLLNSIDSGINDINNNINNIDNSLYTAYKKLTNSKNELDYSYNLFVNEIRKIREEIANKKDEINNIKGYESKFNEIHIQVDDSVNKEELLENIKNNELKNIEILDSYTYDYSPVKSEIDFNVYAMERLSTIIPIIFYIIILIVLFLFISLMIKQSKQDIAILRLLGISNNRIRLGFCINNLIVSLFGIILGLIIGILLMVYITYYYQHHIFVMLPKILYEVDPLTILLCVVVTVIVVELATILATHELDRITPIEVLNKEKYQTKDISNISKKITSIFSPLRKFSIIVYIRNKRNLIFGIICTSATFILVFGSLSVIASKDKMFIDYFDKRFNYNAQLFNTDTISNEYIDDIRKLDYVENADLLKYYNVTLKNKDKEYNEILNALDNKNKYINIYDKNENIIDYPESGIVLEEHIADKLGVKKGDYVEVDGISFKVTDISFQAMGRINYITLKDSCKLTNSYDTVIMKMNNNNQNEFVKKASENDNYVYTVNYDKVKEYTKVEFDNYAIPAYIMIMFSIVIGLIIVININNYNIIDQKKNLSIFRSLGIRYNEISKNWFIQSAIQVVTSIIIGLPLGILFSKGMLKLISTSRRDYLYASGIKEKLLTILILFSYIFICHIASIRKIKKFNVTEEIKDRD